MKMMTLHYHAQHHESMLQTDFVVASNLNFREIASNSKKAKATKKVQVVLKEKGNVKILAIIAKNAKVALCRVPCYQAMANTMLRKCLEGVLFKDKIWS